MKTTTERVLAVEFVPGVGRQPEPRGLAAAYWTFTLLLAVPLLVMGFAALLQARPIAQTMASLGYPSYVMPFTGLAEILGSIAVLTGAIPRLKEWAYAGMVMLFLGAAWSHLRAGQGTQVVMPVLFLIVALISYSIWKRRERLNPL